MTATLPPRIFSPPDMRVQSWQLRDGILSITLRCQQSGACCPTCGVFSTCVHGWYARQIQDLPCQSYRVRLHVDVRRFQCRNAACPRRTFAEALPVACRYQRRSQRLQQVNAQVGLALGGAPGARLLGQPGMHISGDTLLRTLQRIIAHYEAGHPCSSPKEIGIDDWAYRRGHVISHPAAQAATRDDLIGDVVATYTRAFAGPFTSSFLKEMKPSIRNSNPGVSDKVLEAIANEVAPALAG